MNTFPVNSPKWLSKKILKKGGILSFHDFMNIVLNDPKNGYYGSGKAKIGKKGDFVTSPSLSDDFAYLLAKQLEEWLIQISENFIFKEKLTIVEFGSGNGSLLEGIIYYFLKNNHDLIKKTSFIILEINKGMIQSQKIKLNKFLKQGIDISWMNISELNEESINGVVIAHEVLDAFPVERVQYKKGQICRQGIKLDQEKQSLTFKNMPLTNDLKKFIREIKDELGIDIPPLSVSEEWTTELHVNNSSWAKNIYSKINNGVLLIVDYAIDSKRYYSSHKKEGTILAYKDQYAFKEILNNPGDCDITCHICSDILIYHAELVGFKLLGLVKQGEALLSLGLAQKLIDIQIEAKYDLSEALLKREALLRLVDPICLGDFKWFIFQKIKNKNLKLNSKCIN